MTGFIWSPSTDNPVVGVSQGGNFEQGIQPADYRTTYPETNEGMTQYVDVLWTRSYMPGLNDANDAIGALNWMNQLWEYLIPVTGVHVRKVVAGQVVDANGNPVSGATVQLYNTATGLLVDTQTSAADGSYKCGDPNNVASFAIGYLPNAPDTTGATVNTITGT